MWNEKYCLAILSGDWNRKFQILRQEFPAGLSNLHSRCPKKQFWNKLALEKIDFSKFLWLWAELSKVHRACLEGHFCTDNLQKNLNIHSYSSTFERMFCICVHKISCRVVRVAFLCLTEDFQSKLEIEKKSFLFFLWLWGGLSKHFVCPERHFRTDKLKKFS